MLGYDGLSLVTLLHLVVAIPVCGHILLTKEQEAAAVGWIGLVLLSPVIGPLLYWMFGINRVARKARSLRAGRPISLPQLAAHGAPLARAGTEHERQIFQYARSVHDLPFVAGNAVEPLMNGDAAYPAMLAAIDAAAVSVALSVYIFDYDPAGKKFIAALIAAKQRGVTVRVLVDDFGLHYSLHTSDHDLSKAGIPVAHFMPPGKLKFLPFINLRNHRKLLIVDGHTGFIGGMNIRQGHVLAAHPPNPVQDIHFKVVGPVADQMNAVFEEDWLFATDKDVDLPRADPGAAPGGAVLARVVPDGPDDDFEKLQWIILGALTLARSSVRIVTPYFLPNEVLCNALMGAVFRGVDVEVIVPDRSNIRPIGWAMAAVFPRLVGYGVKIYASPPPFDHSKIMIMDGTWTLVGSTNWDPRSLRLNFEANLECYDAALGAALEAVFAEKKRKARPVTHEELKRLPLPVRLRNNFAHLFSPYL